MFRLIVVLAVGFVFAQVPSFYAGYIEALTDDLQTALQSGAPDSQIDRMKREFSTLVTASEIELPMSLIEAWDNDRAVETLESYWEPSVPVDGDGLAYGAVGLVAGYMLTGLIAALFGSRFQPQGKTAAPSRPRQRQRAEERPNAKATAASLIPVSGNTLKEASRKASEAMREVGQTLREQLAEQRATAPERPLAYLRGEDPIQTRVRSRETITFRESRPSGAVTMRYARPAMITRRHELGTAGPIERTRPLRD